MLELTINGTVYQFKFGMGFMRTINKKIGKPVDGLPDVKENVGLQYYVSELLVGDTEALEMILDAANNGMKPRVTTQLLDEYIDDEDTDIDDLFKEVIDFLKKGNATKKTVVPFIEEVEKAKKAQEKEQEKARN